MTGLRAYERDATLPARAGDAELCPPDTQTLLELVRTRLAVEKAPALVSAEWVYARWKPHVALSALYRIRFVDGVEAFVTWKCYRGDKIQHLANEQDEAASEPSKAAQHRLGSFTVLPNGRACLFAFPNDRALPGLSRILDLQRTSRLLKSSGFFGTDQVRWRRSSTELLRYKPEHRAVLRLEMAARDTNNELFTRPIIARVLEPAEALRTHAARRMLEQTGATFAPQLVAFEERTGILFEVHLDLQPREADEFACAREAGSLLARLHALEAPCTKVRSPADLDPLSPLFEIDEHLWSRVLSLGHLDVDSGRTSFVHGDLHPDQLARSIHGGELCLLDWDSTHVGDPLDDVASWIADALVVAGAPDWDRAAHDFLAGYEGGRTPPFEQAALRTRVTRELVLRAAGVLRRLEVGAREKVECILTTASDLSRRTSTARPRSVFERAQAQLLDAAGPAALARVHRTEVRDDGELTFTLDDPPKECWFTTRSGELRELHPHDERSLPGAPALARACEAGSGEVLSWRPDRRMVVRLTHEASSVVVKALRAGRAERSGSLHGAIRTELDGRGFHVPPLILVNRAEETLTFELVRGHELTFDDLSSFHLIGRYLADMQSRSPRIELVQHSCADELAVIDRGARRFERVTLGLPDGFEVARARLGDALDVRTCESVLSHRDLHDGQFLLGLEGVTLFDFDLAASADRELDVANLLAHFHLCALQGRRRATIENTQDAESALLAGYGPGLDPVRLEWYRAATALRIALVYGLRPRYSQVVPGLLALSEHSLKGASRA